MNTAPKHAIRVGPAGWAYDDWKGIVYPSDMPRSVHPLSLLCQWFDMVEINSSFYRPPNPRHAESWVEKVETNSNFRFTAKLWDRFTHQRGEWPNQEEISVFKEGIEPLRQANRLGAILIQFPWSFKRTNDNRLWLGRVTDTFEEYPLALEVRHASWDRPEVYGELAKRGIAFCNIDQPLFRNSLEATDRVTAPLAYVRLHGRNSDDWFREDADRNDRYDYLYSPEELRPWLDKLRAIRNEAEDVYAVTNNHFRGQAVVNAFEIQAAMDGKDVKAPPELLAAYPRLKNLAKADAAASNG